MPLRVCIFTRETLLHWASYYVTAFRQCCDTIAIGPETRREFHDFPDWTRVEADIVRNDITCEETDAVALLERLPDGWIPDIVVAIQSGGGITTGIAELGCPTVYISVDTWHDSREFLLAHQYDFVFLAQKGMVDYMRKSGCCRAFWLPLGCDPQRHRAVELEEIYDIAFVGSTHFNVNRERVARLDRLDRHFNLGFNYGIGCGEMARAYGCSRLVFNSSIASDVNMRVFEALATGKPLITNHDAAANGLFDLFEDDRHLISYTDDNLIARVQRALDDPAWARQIGRAGRALVLQRHTYAHRVQSLISTLQAYLPALGQRSDALFKTGIRMAEFVPLGTRRLLDVGMGLDSSRIALRRRGVHHVAGLAPDRDTLARRERSYDAAALRGPGIQIGPEKYDTIFWARSARDGSMLEEVLRATADALVEGGRVMLALGEPEVLAAAGELSFSAIDGWLEPHGYQLVVWRRGTTGADYHLLVACRRTCPPDELLAMLYEEFPAHGIDINRARVALGPAPDSPGAEHP